MIFIPANPNTDADVALFARKYVAFHLGLTVAARADDSYCHRCHSHVCLTRDFQDVALAMDETIEIFKPLVAPGYFVDSEYDGHWLRLYLFSTLGDNVPLCTTKTPQ